jgi:hypothetical protein
VFWAIVAAANSAVHSKGNANLMRVADLLIYERASAATSLMMSFRVRVG